MTKQIVILGAGFAGIPLAHKLLKTTIPKLTDTKVVLISESTHLYWALAAVRALVPDQVPDDKLFVPVAEGFARYPAAQFELVTGTATGLDVGASTVTVTVAGAGGGGGGAATTTVGYDQLVIATGSRMRGEGEGEGGADGEGDVVPFKHVGSTEATKAALHALQARVAGAGSIVVAGGGPTGVETAAELAHAYGAAKEVTLVVAGERVLAGLLPAVGAAAEKELARMGVRLVHGATVAGVEEEVVAEEAAEGGKKKKGKKLVRLSDGSTLSADLYLPLFGLRANTGFLPASLVEADGGGRLRLDADLRVSGTENVWGVGDVGNIEHMQAIKTEAQLGHLARNLDAVLTAAAGGAAAVVADYKKSDAPMIFVTLGPSKGTGQMFGFKAFSWLVAMVKGKTLLMEKAVAMVKG